jgi:hypothetical protein
VPAPMWLLPACRATVGADGAHLDYLTSDQWILKSMSQFEEVFHRHKSPVRSSQQSYPLIGGLRTFDTMAHIC